MACGALGEGLAPWRPAGGRSRARRARRRAAAPPSARAAPHRTRPPPPPATRPPPPSTRGRSSPAPSSGCRPRTETPADTYILSYFILYNYCFDIEILFIIVWIIHLPIKPQQKKHKIKELIIISHSFVIENYIIIISEPFLSKMNAVEATENI